MSRTILGKKAVLEVDRSPDRNNYVTLTGVARGLGNIEFPVTIQVGTPGGGRGVSGVSEGEVESHDFSIDVNSSTFVDPTFEDANCRRRYYRYSPEGRGTGLPQYIFEAVLLVSLQVDRRTDICTWNVQCAVDGIPALSTQT